MPFAVCVVPVSPLRASSSHSSEMVSQVLFSEAGTVSDETKDFVKITSLYDGYEGWIQRSQVQIADTVPGDPVSKVLTGDWINRVSINGEAAWLPMGTPVISATQDDLVIGHYTIRYQSASTWNAAGAPPTPEAVVARALRYLNTPYLWGGRTVFGIDCSGFAQAVFRFFDLPLLRDAYQQATQGEGIGFLQEAHAGDLAFFDNAEGRITHVGILLNDHSILHASGKVRIDHIDSAGIIHSNTGERTHSLRMIKRYF